MTTNGKKTDSEIQDEVENPNTKALIIMPAAKNAYLLDRVTINFPAEIDSIINDETLTLKGEMDIVKRRALAGMSIFPANDDPNMAEKIDEFVKLIKESEGEKLDYLTSERIQKQFGVGKHA